MILCAAAADHQILIQTLSALSGSQGLRFGPLTATHRKKDAAVAIVAIPMWDTSALLSDMVSSGQGCRFLMVLYDVKFSKTGPVGAMLLPTFP